MEIKDLQKRALEIRNKYAEFERKNIGREWTNTEIACGFMIDAGELLENVMAKEGSRKKENNEDALKHELADCLWSLLVLAEKYKIDAGEIFSSAMDKLEKRIADKMKELE